MKTEEAMTKFLEYLEIERNVSILTVRNYRHYLKRFNDWTAGRYGKRVEIERIGLEDVLQFRLWLSGLTSTGGQRLLVVTQAYHLIALRSWLRWLTRRDVKVLAPEKIELPKQESRSLKWLNREQIDRLLAAPKASSPVGLRDKAILEVLFSTGLRVSELVGLNRESIDLKRREFGVIGKGRRPRVVFLSQRAAQVLGRYLVTRSDNWSPLFVRLTGSKPMLTSKGEEMRLTARSVERLVKKYVTQVRLPVAATVHTLRHSFATDLLRAGAGLREVQELLGHKSITATQIYTHITNPQLKAVHEKYHSGNKNETS